jgi:hypothetical protein
MASPSLLGDEMMAIEGLAVLGTIRPADDEGFTLLPSCCSADELARTSMPSATSVSVLCIGALCIVMVVAKVG